MVNQGRALSRLRSTTADADAGANTNTRAESITSETGTEDHDEEDMDMQKAADGLLSMRTVSEAVGTEEVLVELMDSRGRVSDWIGVAVSSVGSEWKRF